MIQLCKENGILSIGNPDLRTEEEIKE